MNTNSNLSKSLPSADDLSQQLEALRAEMSRLAATISGDVTDGVERAGRQISQTGREAKASATNTVLDHPLASVGIAAAVGLLLGLLARRG